VRTWFPQDSSIFRLASRDDIYEYDDLKLLQTVARPGAIVFDVGANIGLLSIPLRQEVPDIKVVSLEPSDHAGPCLRRTREGSDLADRWIVRHEAVSDHPGTANFFDSSSGRNAFDGLAPTARLSGQVARSVPVTTFDFVWREVKRPAVTVIKIDVEGGEYAVLAGADECLRVCRPVILIE
jgi:FkbM family methyltransferase